MANITKDLRKDDVYFEGEPVPFSVADKYTAGRNELSPPGGTAQTDKKSSTVVMNGEEIHANLKDIAEDGHNAIDVLQVEGEEFEDPQYKLPTSPELARQGTEEYRNILEKLSPEARKLFKNRIEILRCFTGVSPEVKFEEPLEREYMQMPGEFASHLEGFQRQRQSLLEAEAIINDTSTNFYILHSPKGDGNKKEELQLLNITAIKQVMENYPSSFPEEARSNTKEWLLQNQDKWSYGGKNYGLISGFPLASADAFIRGEASVHIHSESHIGYFGTDSVKDNEYVEKLDTIFFESGIVNIALDKSTNPTEAPAT